MKIKEYIVTDPAGVVWNGQIVIAGGAITAASDGRIKSYLHFGQVREAGAVAEIVPAAALATPVIGAPNPEPGSSAPLVECNDGAELAIGLASGALVAAPDPMRRKNR